MDNKELELAHDLLTADEEVILTKAVRAKGTDCDEMKKLQEVYGNFVASVAKEYLNNGLSLASDLSPTPSGGSASLFCML